MLHACRGSIFGYAQRMILWRAGGRRTQLQINFMGKHGRQVRTNSTNFAWGPFIKGDEFVIQNCLSECSELSRHISQYVWALRRASKLKQKIHGVCDKARSKNYLIQPSGCDNCVLPSAQFLQHEASATQLRI